MERAHRRNQADRPAGAPGLAQRGAQLGDGADRRSCRLLRAAASARVALTSASNSSSSSGAASATRRALAGDRGLVAARHRAGQRPLGPEPRPVLDRGADERDELRRARGRRSAPSRSAAASSVIRKFEAIEAAAW